MINHQYTLHTPLGVPITPLRVMRSDIAWAERQVGTTVIEVNPLKYDYYGFHRGQVLTIERSVDNNQPYLFGERLWHLVAREYEPRENANVITLTFFDSNCLLNRRIIAYFDEEPEADKYDFADDMLKELVAENVGGDTEPARDWTLWLKIAAQNGLAPEIEKTMGWQRLLQTMQEICESSESHGTYLSFDVVCVKPPHVEILSSAPRFELEFRTYIGQRGRDRRQSQGGKNLLLGPDFRNLRNVKVKDDWTQEYTHIYAGGEGIGLAREVEEADYPALTNIPPFGRNEGWHDVRELADLPDIAEEAMSFLQQGLTRTRFTGTYIDTRAARWDIDLGFGDVVPLQFQSKSADCRISKVHCTYMPGREGEKIDLTFDGVIAEANT